MATPQVDVTLAAVITASSTDTTSSACAPNKCNPQNVADAGINKAETDVSRWQSALDPTCTSVWLKADWSSKGAYSISQFSIEYAMPAYATLSNLQLTSTSSGLLQSLQAYSCNTTYLNDKERTNRVDTCIFDSSQHGGYVWDTVAARLTFTFGQTKPEGCQVAIDELVILGLPSAVSVPGNSSGNNSNNTPSSLSIGAIVGIVIASLVLVGILAVFVMRQRNLRLRRLAKKLYDERRVRGGNGYALHEENDDAAADSHWLQGNTSVSGR